MGDKARTDMAKARAKAGYKERAQVANDKMSEDEKHNVKAWMVFHPGVTFADAVCYTLGANPGEL
jgi:hypothetical protein